MAVQSSFYLVDGSTRTFPSTKHIATKQHCAIYLKDKVSLLWSVASVDTYSLINNSIVFDIAPASATYSDIEVRVADTQDELVNLPSDIAIVASNIANVNLVGQSIDDVNIIGDNIDALLVIPANLTSINTVSSNITNVNIIGNNTANINTVASDLLEPASEINTVATNIANVNTVGINIANVNTVASNTVNINAVATNTTNINSVATHMTDINVVYNNMAELLTVNENAAIVTSLYDQFDDRYLGSKTVAPTLDNDNNALLIGALYFDTTQSLMKVNSSSGWVSAGSSVNGTTERHTYTATAGQTSFSANYESGYVDVFLNGSKLQSGVDFTATSGTAIVLISSANVGDIIDIVAYGVFEVANTTPKGNEAYTVSTVADLTSVPSSYTTAIVKDLDDGGVFSHNGTSFIRLPIVIASATKLWKLSITDAGVISSVEIV